jgi:hypothetical protein
MGTLLPLRTTMSVGSPPDAQPAVLCPKSRHNRGDKESRASGVRVRKPKPSHRPGGGRSLPAAALSTGPGTRLAVRAGKQQPTRPSSAHTGAADEQTPVRLTPENGSSQLRSENNSPEDAQDGHRPVSSKTGQVLVADCCEGRRPAVIDVAFEARETVALPGASGSLRSAEQSCATEETQHYEFVAMQPSLAGQAVVRGPLRRRRLLLRW